MADIKPIVGGAGSSQFRQLQAGDFLVGNTPTAGDNSTKYATTAYVTAAAPTKTGTGASGTWGISVTGNAATATSAASLTTARTIALSGAATGTATSFNGSANITIPVTALNATNLTTGTVPDARLSGTYTGISVKVPNAGAIFSSNDGADNRVVSHVCSYRATGTVTGAIVFSAPSVTGIMCVMKIVGQLYVNEIVDLTVKGYYTTSWVQTKLQHFGTTKPMVRLGKNAAGRPCVILGDTDSVWSYPHFALELGLFSHSGADDPVATGWSSALVTDMSAFTAVTAALSETLIPNVAAADTLATPRTLTIGASGKTFNGSANVAWTLAEIGAQANLGYEPVQQGGGAGQSWNKLYIGWLGSNLGLQVDTTNFGANWPINVTGTAAGSVTNGSGVATITKLTAAAYAALGTKDASTLYVIVG